MSNIINLKRLWNLFYLDFAQGKKYYLLLMAQTFGFVVMLYSILRFLCANDTTIINIHIFVFYSLLVIIGVVNTISSNKPINNSLENIFYFTLPVSSFERFLFTLIKFLVLYPIFLSFVYLLAYNLSVLIDNLTFLNIKNSYLLKQTYSKYSLNAYLNYIVLFPVFFIGSIVFKKSPLVKTTTIVLFSIILFSIFSTFVSYFFIQVLYGTNIFKVGGVETITGKINIDDFNIPLYLLAIFLYIAAYFKLEEYELKN